MGVSTNKHHFSEKNDGKNNQEKNLRTFSYMVLIDPQQFPGSWAPDLPAHLAVEGWKGPAKGGSG
jgi:hypothetical protein